MKKTRLETDSVNTVNPLVSFRNSLSFNDNGAKNLKKNGKFEKKKKISSSQEKIELPTKINKDVGKTTNQVLKLRSFENTTHRFTTLKKRKVSNV